ncbi:helix-turn-helix domain-containing protein [Mesorhizobium atlanticum]
MASAKAIRNALAAENGNLSKVALRLGISRPTLYRKLDQYGIRRGSRLSGGKRTRSIRATGSRELSQLRALD